MSESNVVANGASGGNGSRGGFMNSVKRLLQMREIGVLLALIALLIAMCFLSPYFWKPTNIFNVLRGMSTIGIMAIGQTMIIVTGGIDLSVGSVLAASAMLTARLMFTGSDAALDRSCAGSAPRHAAGPHQWPHHHQAQGEPLHHDTGHVEHRPRLDLPAGIGAEGNRGQQRAHARRGRQLFWAAATSARCPFRSSR